MAKGPDGKPGLVIRPITVQVWPMLTIVENRHDTGEKTCLGTKFPAGQDTAKDIGDFLQLSLPAPEHRALFRQGDDSTPGHFQSKPRLHQAGGRAFKTSNGDMKTVISAILLDDEARNPANAKQETFGKLREPWLRLTELARGFNAAPATQQPFYGVSEKQSTRTLGQYPLSAPSVFNFYLPNYQPPGTISDRNANATDGTTLLVAPEFQIMNSNTALLTPNYLMDLIRNDGKNSRPNSGVFALDLTPQINLAGDPAALVDNVSTILTGGMMSDRTRGIITTAVGKITPANDPAVLKERARMAIYLTMASPDYAVQK